MRDKESIEEWAVTLFNQKEVFDMKREHTETNKFCDFSVEIISLVSEQSLIVYFSPLL